MPSTFPNRSTSDTWGRQNRHVLPFPRFVEIDGGNSGTVHPPSWMDGITRSGYGRPCPYGGIGLTQWSKLQCLQATTRFFPWAFAS